MGGSGHEHRGVISDGELVAACQAGDRLACQALVSRYERMVQRLAYRFTGVQQDAEDLAQEVFLRAFQQLAAFRCASSFGTWLYRIAVNTSQNASRSQKRTCSLEEMDEEPGDRELDPARVFARQELSEALNSAIRALPEPLQAVFILVAQEESSYAEAAEILSISVEAVRMRMCRARRLLRCSLDRQWKDEETPDGL